MSAPRESFSPQPEDLIRGHHRVVELLLQAALREGLLAAESPLLSQGQLLAQGHRFRLRGEAPPLREAIAALPGGGTHRREALRSELERAAFIQACAYRAALRRRPPRRWPEWEAWTPEGHNLHPGAKTRQGFSDRDWQRYSPEFCDIVELPWLAVDKRLMSASGTVPATWELNRREWAVPVHPWQSEHVLPQLFAAEFRDGRLRPLPREPLRVSPTSTLRTVIPEDLEWPILKLSVGALMTSTERSMSSHTVRNGPLYSELLRRAWAQGGAWSERVQPLEELGGLYWTEAQESGPRSRQLSILWRRRPALEEDQWTLPCSALPQPWGEGLQSGCLAHLFSLGEGPLASLRRYCELLIPVHLALFAEWGIALEAHLQNCLMAWSEQGPERLWLRDWGGLRAVPERWGRRAPDLLCALDRRAVTLSSEEAAVRKLVACLYSNHLTEIVVGLHTAFGLSLSRLWAIVEGVTRETLTLWPDPLLASAILEQPWPVKALLRMRWEEAPGDLYGRLPNPWSTQPVKALD